MNAYPAKGIGNCNTWYCGNTGVRPASNLNLSNVLFASAAATELNTDNQTKIIEENTAMTLRLKGDKGEIGTATISENSNKIGQIIGGDTQASGRTITVTRGSTGKDVYLVIQGKNPNSDTDWYWSKKISKATETISDVEGWTTNRDVLNGYGIDWSLSDCKIWLEIKDDDGMLYAAEAVKQENEKCDHDYKLVKKKPTRTENGYKAHYECTKCGKWFEYKIGIYIEITNKSAYIIPATGESGSSSSSNINTGWIKDTKGWRYRNSDGTLAQGTTVSDKEGNKVEKLLWQKAGSGYFAFGSDGYLLTGWIYDKLDDKWYYCDENNGKLYGWFLSPEDGYWYYLSLSTGEALTGWQSINGKDYYFAGAPSAPTYSFDSSTGFWIYSNIQGIRPFGSMYASTVTPDNYVVDASGAWIH